MSVSGMVTAAGNSLASVSMNTNLDNVGYTRGIGGNEFFIDAWSIQLALHGGGLSELSKVFFKFIMEMMWTAYQACVWVVAWFADFAMGMGWLSVIRAPFDTIQGVLQEILNDFNLYATMLLISALICVIWMARGQWGKGILELFIALIIANYAIASLGGNGTEESTPVQGYSPLNIMLGQNNQPDDACMVDPQIEKCGLLTLSRDFGTSTVGKLDAGMEGEDGFNPTSPGESIIKTFLFYPVQLVNFGEVLTEECQDAYALFLWAKSQNTDEPGLDQEQDDPRPWGEDDGGKLNDVIGEHVSNDDAAAAGDHVYYDEDGYSIPGACMTGDEDAYEDQANIEGILTQFFVGPSVGLLGLVVIIIAGAVILAGVNAVLQCFKLLFTLLMAILPRGARRSLWVTVGSALTSLLILIFAIIFLGTFLVIIQQIFEAQSGNSFGARMGTFLMVDVLLVIGVIIFWRGRKAVAESKDKMANALSSMGSGGGGAGSFGGGGGAGGGGGMAGAAGKAHLAADIGRDLTGGKHMHDMVGKRRRAGATPGGIAGPGGAPGRSTGGAMVKAGAKKGVGKLATTVAAGAATGGSSLLVQGGAMAAKSGAVKAGAKAVGGVAKGAGRGARWVGNRAMKGAYSQFGNEHRANKLNTLNRRREQERMKRAQGRRMRWHDVDSRMVDGAAAATNGRFGTAKWQKTRQQTRQEKLRKYAEDSQAKRREQWSDYRKEKNQMKNKPEQMKKNNRWHQSNRATRHYQNARSRRRRRNRWP